ncbi:MAG TPA: methyltransferase domain-containing protein [Acetobacteraceae bacterium]|jgi:ubiquinone/menaquinone biosynthesis C-methylase UbiE|nr:methyltransferase domain-containing protein [Acetobacteraceae bacterium]
MTQGASLYDGWAPFYDRLLGEAGFQHIWPAFCRAARRFGMRITSAADFGCGTGLFLAALSQAAPKADLLGIDRSREMLRVATRRLAGRNVQLFRADLRDVCLPRRVDLVTCNFSTLNYFVLSTDMQLAFRNFVRHLKKGGFVAIDFLCSGGGKGTRKFVQKISLPGMMAIWHIRSNRMNTRAQVVMRNCRCQPRGCRCWQEAHDQRWWSIAEVTHHLRTAGLVALGVTALGEVPPSRGGRWVQVVARRA